MCTTRCEARYASNWQPSREHREALTHPLDQSLQGHTALLQLDSSLDDPSGEIMWGDMGVACFLIEPERLSRCDFSNVLYTWDCG
ncbi:MAG: DUF1963 domain-containing protein [Actinobacteria bacterium]|nr:DUF1963 domain-containing protein [Actinomycetota bacterium]